MRGSIVKRGTGYSIVYRAPDPATGKVKQTWKGGYATKRQAEAALKEIVAEVDAGTYVRPSRQTIREYMEKDWLPSLDAAVAGGSPSIRPLRPSTATWRRPTSCHGSAERFSPGSTLRRSTGSMAISW